MLYLFFARPCERPILGTTRVTYVVCPCPVTSLNTLMALPSVFSRPECIGESEDCAWDPVSCTGETEHEEGGKPSTSYSYGEETYGEGACQDGYVGYDFYACTEDPECVTCLYGPGADECRTSTNVSDYDELDCSDANVAWLCCVLRDQTCAKNSKFAALAGERFHSLGSRK